MLLKEMVDSNIVLLKAVGKNVVSTIKTNTCNQQCNLTVWKHPHVFFFQLQLTKNILLNIRDQHPDDAS